MNEPTELFRNPTVAVRRRLHACAVRALAALLRKYRHWHLDWPKVLDEARAQLTDEDKA